MQQDRLGPGVNRQIRVAIIGAGLGGVAAAVKLKSAGIDTFTVFEKADGAGGVWWHNSYPGCEVDVPSHTYSYSFMPYEWSGTHAKQCELRQYVADVIERFELGAHFRYGTEVESAVWDDAAHSYTLLTGDGDAFEFDVCVSAVGLLSNPKLPDWPGIPGFKGPVFHTAQFDHSVDLTGKTVALVGTGSSACQLGPAIAPVVKKLDVYQREPGHVLPKKAREFDPALRRRYGRFPILQKIERLKQFRVGMRQAQALDVRSRRNAEVESYFHHYLAKTVTDPDTRAALTPAFPYGCKRPIFASTYYPMFNRDNVELIPHAVAEVTPGGLVDATGTERDADVLVLCTGFQVSDLLATLRVTGTRGQDLHEVWAGEPWAFLGMTVPGFPNFLMMYGPNTNGLPSIIGYLETQAATLVRMVTRLQRGRALAYDTNHGLARRVDRWVQSELGRRLSAVSTGCRNYNFAGTGKNVGQWPRSHISYRLAARLLTPWGLVARRHPARADSPVATGAAR